MQKLNEEVIGSAVSKLAKSLIEKDNRDVVVMIPKGTRFNTRNKLTYQIIKVLRINSVYSELRKSDLYLVFRLNIIGGVSMTCGSAEGIVEEANLTIIDIDSFIEMLKDTINGVEVKEENTEDTNIVLVNKLIRDDIERMKVTSMVLRLLIPKNTNKGMLLGIASNSVLEALKKNDLIMTVKNGVISYMIYEDYYRSLFHISDLSGYIELLIHSEKLYKNLGLEKPVDTKKLFKDNIHKLDNIKDGIYINPVEFAKSTNIAVLMDLGLLEDKTSISNLFTDICSESGNPYIFGQAIIKEKITLIHYINGVSCIMNIRLKDLEKLNVRPINSLDELMELVISL